MKIPRAIACAAALLCAGFAHGEGTPSGQAAMLQAQYAEFRGEPVESRFHRPLRIESSEGKQAIAGQIHALVDSPYAVTVAALKDPSHWCEILLLHLDTKDCHVFSEDGGTALRMGVVTHYDQPPSSAFSATFKYHVAEETRDFLDVRLDAAKGPMGTSNYLIVLEAMPAEGGQTFIRMSYSYAYGVMAKIAMSAYFVTFGRGKVGFTIVSAEPGGPTHFIGGMRGVVERNTMRYYLAVEAYLAALSAPEEARREKSLRDWYAAVEHYPVQLHEMEQGEYLAMKRREFAAQS